jgi:hypothetical protein
MTEKPIGPAFLPKTTGGLSQIRRDPVRREGVGEAGYHFQRRAGPPCASGGTLISPAGA